MYIFLCVALLFAHCSAQEDLESEETFFQCDQRNGYYRVNGTCDAYYECTDYEPFGMLCPDGLNYNPKANWPAYPCSYPSEVPCVDNDYAQPPQPTADCPRQFGFFKSPFSRPTDCGQYRICAGGIAYDMSCPFGLAFDLETASCNWPDLVPGCNHEDFLGFICPVPEYDSKGNPLTVNFEYEPDCSMFYSCQSGRARLLSCGASLAFDSNTGRCSRTGYMKCIARLGERYGENEN